MTHYICKYTPVELLRALGGECVVLDQMPDSFPLSDQLGHPNLCGFGQAVLEQDVVHAADPVAAVDQHHLPYLPGQAGLQPPLPAAAPLGIAHRTAAGDG